MADEEIITRFTVESSDAVKKIEELRGVTESIKVQLKSLATDTKESMNLVSKGLTDAFKTERLGQLKEELKTLIDPKAIKAATSQATTDIKNYSVAMTQALKEVRQEETALGKETAQQAKIQSDARKQEEQSAKQVAKSISEAEKQKQQAAREATQNLIRNNQQQATIMKQLDSQTKETSGTFRLFGQEIKNAGDLARIVFVGILGVTAYQTIRQLINGLQEAIKSGYELAKAMYQLGVGINVLRRTGVEITLQDMYENLDKLGKRFAVFSTKELIEGSAALVNLIRDFGLTKEQIFKLQESIATLAIVNGRAMDDVQRTVALALSSGYTEGLQRLGVSINRVTIAQKAAELGYKGNYMALTEVQRAEATYVLILEKTAKYQNDLAKYQETSAGKIDKLKAGFKDLTSFIGSSVLPAMAAVADMLSTWISRADEYYKTLMKIKREGVVPTEFQVPPQVRAQLAGTRQPRIPPAEAVPPYARGTVREQMLKAKDELMPFDEEAVAEQNKLADQITSVVEDYVNDITNEAEDYKKALEDNEKDLQRDLEKIDRDSSHKRVDIWRDYTRELADIDTQMARDIAEAQARYAIDVAQAQRQADIRRAELEAKYRENEKKAEIRFQEELRKLREGFIFDLEDALRERDARQVLRLIRQYNLQKTQATRQYEIEKEERRRAYKLELEDLEKQTRERLRILAEELSARISAIQTEAAYRKQEAEQKYLQDIADEAARVAAQKQERMITDAQKEEDIAKNHEDKMKEIAKNLYDELKVTTAEGLDELKKALDAVLGPGGDAEKIFNYYKTIAAETARSTVGSLGAVITALGALFSFDAAVRKASEQFGVSTPSGGGGGGARKGRQGGGPVYKGEVYKVHKDETFVPAVNGRILSVKQSQNALTQAYAPAYTSRGEGKVKIGVSLSPELIGEIQDNTLDAVAGVVFELERKRK